MARDIAINELVRWTNPFDLTAGAFSIAMRHNPDGVAGGDLYVWAIANNAGNKNGSTIRNVSANKLEFKVVATGGGTSAIVAYNSYSAVEQHICCTYDGTFSGTATDHLKLYVDGVSRADASVNPSGSVENAQNVHGIGNRLDAAGSDDNPGIYGDFAIWDRVLTADEAAALSDGYSPLYFQNGLRNYYPLITNSNDLVGGTTISTYDNGTTVAHFTKYISLPPPLIFHAPAAAPAGANPKGPLGMPLHGPLAGPIG